jgi:hypothetical protein
MKHKDIQNDDKVFDSKYDAWYDQKKDIWLEGKCSDPSCCFCKDRPNKPSDEEGFEVL